MSNLPAGREPADARRAERVACAGRLLEAIYEAARIADGQRASDEQRAVAKTNVEAEARRFIEALEREEAAAARERQRRSEAVHGPHPKPPPQVKHADADSDD